MITWDCSTIWIRCGSRVRRLRSNEIFVPCRKTWMTHIILENYFDWPSFILLTLPWTWGWIWSPSPNEDLKDMEVLCTFKIEIESQNSDHVYIKDQWSYPNQYQDAKPQSGASSVFRIILWRKNWNKSVSKTSYPDFGTRQDSKVFWARLIGVKIKFKSWASLSWFFWAKLICDKLIWKLSFSEPIPAELSLFSFVSPWPWYNLLPSVIKRCY